MHLVLATAAYVALFVGAFVVDVHLFVALVAGWFLPARLALWALACTFNWLPRYVPRLTERSLLHEVVRENLETLLAQARARTEHGFGVPRSLDVAFSCKRRGACPSCSGRRAAACAIHLVDAVFPSTPTRMWTLTFPRRLRFALATPPR